MPYNSVAEAESSVPAIKDLSLEQKEEFVKIINRLLEGNMKEGEAIPIAISEVKGTNKDEDVRLSSFTLTNKAKSDVALPLSKPLERTTNSADTKNPLDLIEDAGVVEKGTPDQVTRDSNGNLVYRGIKFAGYGKPRKSDNPKKDRMVLVKDHNKVVIVRYGDASMRQNYSVEANDRFYDRFSGRPEADDKFSATYWSLRDLWPRGDLKGKGAKPLTSLKKSHDIQKLSTMQGLSTMFYGLSCMFSSKHKESGTFDKYDDLYEDTCEDRSGQTEIEESYVDISERGDNTLNIIKQLDDEEMVAIEPLYINAGEVDLHGDGISSVELDKLIDNFNKNIENIKGNIQHAYMTEGFKPLKAYRLPMDVYIGNPANPSEMILVKEGQPIVKLKFADTEVGKYLWDKRKSGKLLGVSIGAKGKRVPNPDYVARKGEGGYVSVKLHKEDAEAIQFWLKSLNISETIKAEDLHATLYYTEKGIPVLNIDKEKIYMADVSDSPIEMGNEDSEWYAITLPVSSDSLTKRHSFIKEYSGSEYSYKDYKPHLSLKYKPSPEDIAKIKSSTLPLKTLRFYKESQEDLF